MLTIQVKYWKHNLQKSNLSHLVKFDWIIEFTKGAHVLCQNYANCVRRFFVIIAYVRTMQTVSEVCKLCPKDANCVRSLQTMSEGCKLCQKVANYVRIQILDRFSRCKLCQKFANCVRSLQTESEGC